MGRRFVALLFLVVLVGLVVLPLAQGQAPVKTGLSGPPAIRSGYLHLAGLERRATALPAVPLAAQGWTTLLSEGFEGAFPGTTWDLYGDTTWGTTTHRAHDGSHSAYCAGGGPVAVSPPGPYPNEMNAWMVYGPFDLSQAVDAEVVFSYYSITELEYDQFWVVASPDGGDWYGSAFSGDWVSECGGWCDDGLSLTDLGDLGNLCGQPEVYIAFVFQSDEDTQYEGSYVDDITLRAMVEGAETPTPTATATVVRTPTPTATATVELTLTPTPSATATGALTRTPTPTLPPSSAGQIYLPLVRRTFADGPLMASAVIRTDQEGTVIHPTGARMFVPRGAVPPTESGQDGEMLFTLESGTAANFGVPDSPPAGYQFAGSMYSLGPEGFTFALPVTVRLPRPASVTTGASLATIFDYDRTLGQWKNVGGTVSRDGASITVDLQDLNSVVVYGFPTAGCGGVGAQGAGAIQFDAVPAYSFKLCIESYTLKYPDYDRNFVAAGRINSVIRRDSPQCPVDGQVYWILPQGTYTIDVGVYYHRYDDRPPEYLGYFQRTVTIDQPHFDWQFCNPGNFLYTSFFGAMVVDPSQLNPGPLPCAGAATPSVGIGTVNVRLEWSVRADLDLWVVDPCGQRIYWLNDSRTCQGSQGRLDLDNLCGGVIGRPENIYWATNAPVGTYKVYVDNYASCGGTSPVDYTVRWWVKGAAYSKRGTINPPASIGNDGDEVLVTEFVN